MDEMRLQRRIDGQYDLTINGKHVATFKTLEEFAEKIEEIERKSFRDPANGQIMGD